MRAKFSDEILSSRDGQEMTSILRACVHCGFCNATCPTYQLTGDELDGPRGRIYLIKSMLEASPVGPTTQLHLDACLTCRACETTCPSGVRYSRLLEIARPLVDAKVTRGLGERLVRWALRRIVPYPRRFGAMLRLAQLFKPMLPASLTELLPAVRSRSTRPGPSAHERHMVMLEGCVQATVSPGINDAAEEIFEACGIALRVPPDSGCCGAVAYHLGAIEEARKFARNNIDAWTSALERGAEAVIATSSGCAVMLKEYAELLVDDPNYAERARHVADIVRDPAEVIDAAVLGRLYQVPETRSVAFHAPCTLQHGLRANAKTEACLRAAGFSLKDVADSHLCCGSAGSYSLLQPRLANQLLEQKLAALTRDDPMLLVSANIGCLLHLQRRADRPVVHWLELIRPHRVGP